MNFIVYCLYSVLGKVIQVLPLKVTRCLVNCFTFVFYYIIPIRKNVAVKNISACFPELSDKEVLKIVKDSYKNILTVFAEFFYMTKLSDEQLRQFLKIPEADIFHNILKRNKGLIIISAHFGNWELNAFGGARVLNTHFNVIVKKFTNELVDKKINQLRESRGNRMIEMQNSPKEALKAMHNKEVVAILSDQAAPYESQVKVDFFVKDVPVFTGAASFAIKTQTPILFAITFRNNDCIYTVNFTEINVEKYKDYNTENIKALTQEHVNLLMKAIKKKPDHWLWFHKRFKHTSVKY